MSSKPIYGLARKPGSLAHLSKFTRGWNDSMAMYLLPLAYQDFFYKRYDMENDTITSDWTVNESAAGSTVFASSTSVENGAIVGVTTTTDNTTISFNYDGVFFDANRSPGMRVRMKASAITDLYLEFGFSDAPTQPYTINWALDTPTLQSNGTTDVATVVIDTDATQKTAALCAVGTTDSTAVKRNLSAHGFGANGGSVSNYDVPGAIPIAADTYFDVMIQINSAASATAGANSVSAVVNGSQTLSGTVDAGLDTAVKLRPYIICGNRSTSAKTFTVDLVEIWCNRA